MSHLKGSNNIRAHTSELPGCPELPTMRTSLKCQAPLLAIQAGKEAITPFSCFHRGSTASDRTLTPCPHVLIRPTGTLHFSAMKNELNHINTPPWPHPPIAIALNHPYLFLPSPHLLFHFRDSLSFGEHGGMIVASAGGGDRMLSSLPGP